MEARMKLQKKGGCGGGGGEGGGGGAIITPPSYHSGRGSSGRPSWLLFAIADLDERMKMLTRNVAEEDNSAADSFAKRAEEYYEKRPQLLALLQELYNTYLSLADRYCQALAKNNHHRRRYSSPISPLNFNENGQFDEDGSGDVIDSDDAASSLSYQTPFAPAALELDVIVADLVMKSVDYDLIFNELSIMEKKSGESSRKIELQKSLLDVLESERLILLNENAGLAYRVNALLEENKGLVSESLFMKRKAADLARCVLKMREDHRVCMLSRKIEDLQGQIYGLEKRNKEYYDQLVKHEREKKSRALVAKTNNKSPAQVTLEDCFHVNEDLSCFGSLANGKKGCLPTDGSINRGRKGSKLWDKVMKFDFCLCVPRVNSTYC